MIYLASKPVAGTRMDSLGTLDIGISKRGPKTNRAKTNLAEINLAKTNINERDGWI